MSNQNNSAANHRTSTAPGRPTGRSKLDSAMRSMSSWTNKDREFFISAFTTRKTSHQIANELGLSHSGFQERRREILRRFMRAADIHVAA